MRLTLMVRARTSRFRRERRCSRVMQSSPPWSQHEFA